MGPRPEPRVAASALGSTTSANEVRESHTRAGGGCRPHQLVSANAFHLEQNPSLRTRETRRVRPLDGSLDSAGAKTKVR